MKSKISKAVKRIMTNEDMERFKEEMAWQMVLKKTNYIRPWFWTNFKVFRILCGKMLKIWGELHI